MQFFNKITFLTNFDNLFDQNKGTIEKFRFFAVDSCIY